MKKGSNRDTIEQMVEFFLDKAETEYEQETTWVTRWLYQASPSTVMLARDLYVYWNGKKHPERASIVCYPGDEPQFPVTIRVHDHYMVGYDPEAYGWQVRSNS